MKGLKFQFKPTLIVNNGRVISFDTEVGRIKDNKLYVFGHYSRTTTKHISYLRDVFDLEVIMVQKKPKIFYKYETGEWKNDKPEDALSPTISVSLFNIIKNGGGLFDLIKQNTCITKRDWEIIVKQFKLPKNTPRPNGSSEFMFTWHVIKSPHQGDPARVRKTFAE